MIALAGRKGGISESGLPEWAGDDLNTKCFIHARDFDSWEALADHVMEVDQAPGLYEAYLKQPLLNRGDTAAKVVSMSESRKEKPPRSVA